MGDILPQLQIYIDAGQWLSGLGTRVSNYLFRPSGWTIPDDTDTGISFGNGEEAGVGYMEMDLKDIRHPTRQPRYELRGLYAEAGFGKDGLGQKLSLLQQFVEKLVKRMPKGVRPSSDIIIMPGGSIGQFITGPANTKQLEISDFRTASWIYLHIGGEIVFLQGDIGLMFMVDPISFWPLVNAAVGNIGGALASCMGACLAWAPYYGFALGLGAGGKVALRWIQTVHMTDKGSAVAIL